MTLVCRPLFQIDLILNFIQERSPKEGSGAGRPTATHARNDKQRCHKTALVHLSRASCARRIRKERAIFMPRGAYVADDDPFVKAQQEAADEGGSLGAGDDGGRRKLVQQPIDWKFITALIWAPAFPVIRHATSRMDHTKRLGCIFMQSPLPICTRFG